MTDILSSITSLVGLITDTASKVKVSKKHCSSLARRAEWAESELKMVPNVETSPALSALQSLLQECLNDLENFANPHETNGILESPVSEICTNHEAALIAWVDGLRDQVTAVSKADVQPFSQPSSPNGQCISQGDSESLDQLLKTADQGDAKAQLNIGVLYHKGEGVPQDDSKAMEWYSKAANQGDDNAQFNIGTMYYNGNGVPQDDHKAMEWYLKAANQGYARAQLKIGVMYHKGQGVPQDDHKAME
ncbi:hypothetical protein BGZ83_000448, partial [Gryganskiella cystojenkinii]